MKERVKIGTEGELRFQVEPKHAIELEGGDVPAVLSTPWLIWFLEHAARNALQPVLDADECTVGVVVNLEHLAATLVGAEVVCRARVIYVDSLQISFQLEARDEHEAIARGTHKRQIVKRERLARRLRKKMT